MITDEQLLKCYRQGFDDELDGTTSIEYDTVLENKAYKIGADHAIVGDDVRSVDYLSNEQVLELIKNE